MQAQILNLLLDLTEHLGLTMIFISHQLSVIANVADDVAVMYLGRIVEYGPVEEVFEHPQHPYTAALLAANPEPVPERRRRQAAIRGDIPSPLDIPSGCRFRTRCAYAEERCAEVDPPAADGRARAHGPLRRAAVPRAGARPRRLSPAGRIASTTTSPSTITGRSSRNRLQFRIGMSRWQLVWFGPPTRSFGPVEKSTLPENARSSIPWPRLSVASAAHLARSSRPQPMCESPYASGSSKSAMYWRTSSAW